MPDSLAGIEKVLDNFEVVDFSESVNIIDDSRYVDIRPNSEPQLLFFNNAPKNKETLYGGAAGGGKTFSIVALPIYHGFHLVNGFRGQIFRETVPQLNQYIIPLCNKIYPLAGGRYNDQKKVWTFPEGATISLGYMEHEGDWENYASGNNTYQAFDEATKMLASNFNVTAWNRTECGVPAFRVYGTNPGGRSHMKFKKDFVDKCPPIKAGLQKWSRHAQMWWQPMRAGDPVDVEVVYGGIRRNIRRQFIPARVFDNEDLLRLNPDYIADLMSLGDPDMIKKLLEGDWGIIEGQFLEMLREDIHFINSNSLNIQPDWPVLAGMDYGNVTTAGIMRSDHNGDKYLTNEWTALDKTASWKAMDYRKFLIKNGFWNESDNESKIVTIGDSNMFYTSKEQTVKVTAADKFKLVGHKMKVVSKKSPDHRGFRKFANDEVKDSLTWQKDSEGRFLIKPKLYICYDKCPYTAETIPQLQKDKHYPEDLDQEMDYSPTVKGIDHWYDMLKYILISFKKPVDKKHVDEAQKRMEARKRKSLR